MSSNRTRSARFSQSGSLRVSRSRSYPSPRAGNSPRFIERPDIRGGSYHAGAMSCGVIEIPDAQLAAIVVAHWGDQRLDDQATSFAVAIAESCGGGSFAHADAWNQVGEDSRGAWQVNVAPGANTQFATWNLFDPDTCASAARIIYDNNGGTFLRWTTFTQGVYGAYLPRAYAALAALTFVPPGPPYPPLPQPPTAHDLVLGGTPTCDASGRTTITYLMHIPDGLPTYLLIARDPGFSGFEESGPYFSDIGFVYTPAAPGVYYASLNRYALVANLVVTEVTNLMCGGGPGPAPGPGPGEGGVTPLLLLFGIVSAGYSIWHFGQHSKWEAKFKRQAVESPRRVE
jgi:hypothetical protein